MFRCFSLSCFNPRADLCRQSTGQQLQLQGINIIPIGEGVQGVVYRAEDMRAAKVAHTLDQGSSNFEYQYGIVREFLFYHALKTLDSGIADHFLCKIDKIALSSGQDSVFQKDDLILSMAYYEGDMLKLRHELETRFNAETFGRLHTRIVEVEKYIERQLRELGIDLGDSHCKNYLYTKCSSPPEIDHGNYLHISDTEGYVIVRCDLGVAVTNNTSMAQAIRQKVSELKATAEPGLQRYLQNFDVEEIVNRYDAVKGKGTYSRFLEQLAAHRDSFRPMLRFSKLR